MSENAVPQEERCTTLDFTGVNVLGLPGGGGGGIVSINADTTPAQTLVVIGTDSGLHIADPGAGEHDFTLDVFEGIGTPGSVPNPPVYEFPEGYFLAADGTWQHVPSGGIRTINADSSVDQTLMVGGDNPLTGLHINEGGGGYHYFVLDSFAGVGVPGSVPDPLASPATDYLAADGTFKPIPGGAGTTIQASSSTVPIPQGTLVNLNDIVPGMLLTVPSAGVWVFTLGIQTSNLVLAGYTNSLAIVQQGLSYSNLTGAASTVGITPGIGTGPIDRIYHSVISPPIPCLGGEIIYVFYQQDSAVEITISAVLNGLKLGS